MADFGHFSTIFGQEIGKIQKIAFSPGARPGVATICGLLAYKRDSAAGSKLPYAKFKIWKFWPKSSKNGPFGGGRFYCHIFGKSQISQKNVCC